MVWMGLVLHAQQSLDRLQRFFAGALVSLGVSLLAATNVILQVVGLAEDQIQDVDSVLDELRIVLTQGVLIEQFLQLVLHPFSDIKVGSDERGGLLGLIGFAHVGVR